MARGRKWALVALLALGCGAMALVDGWLQPGYAAKSAAKLLLFLGLPLLYARALPKGPALRSLCRFRRRGLLPAALLGLGVYGAILGAYFTLGRHVDLSGVTRSLARDAGVTAQNFPLVALYIALVNSLLEEFFFRGFGFLLLRPLAGRTAAYGVSAGAFALYHVAMLGGWAAPWLLALAILALFGAGLLFNWLDERSGGLLPSWAVHLAANLGLNTVGLILFAAGA